VTSTARTAVELRRQDVHIVVHADGSAWTLSRQEIRVVSGELDHLEYDSGKFMRQFTWWSTAPAQLVRVSGSLLPSREPEWHLRFAEPLRARDAAWHWLYAEGEWPKRYYRMTYDPPSGAGKRPDPKLEREVESIVAVAQGVRFARRMSPDAHIRLQMVFPEGYPLGRVRLRVRVTPDRVRTDLDEERRIARLAHDAFHQDGLRRDRHAITLSVPHPLLDRDYAIEWGLPTNAQRDRWWASRGGFVTRTKASSR
jgi:hypothetical protein